ncbi:TatD family hydrolase [Candidatus Woesearchaeota archaeon]|nr:TatD family hydrolase [Candidatus Woesearchaeota archaeon]
MNPLVDVHAHLDHKQYTTDLDDVIKRSIDKGLKLIIANGVNPPSNRQVLQITKKYEIVKAALGLYPIDALNCEGESSGFSRTTTPVNVEEELEFIKSQKDNIVALGEVGLDYYWVKDKQKEMINVFNKIISLSQKIKKPMIVHSRKAELDTIETLESASAKNVIMHCFSGKKKYNKRIIDNGWYFTIPTNVERALHFHSIINEAPITKLLTETDAPYLCPIKDQRNEPWQVQTTIKKIAELKGLDEKEVSLNIYNNTQKLFL